MTGTLPTARCPSLIQKYDAHDNTTTLSRGHPTAPAFVSSPHTHCLVATSKTRYYDMQTPNTKQGGSNTCMHRCGMGLQKIQSLTKQTE